MFFHDNNAITCVFSDRAYVFNPQKYRGLSAQSLVAQMPTAYLQKFGNLDALYTVHQVHGVQGFVVNDTTSLYEPSFFHEADFLITRQRRCGLLIATADCMPLVLYHEQKKVLAVAHVGWRGAVAGIFYQILQKSFNLFKTDSVGWIVLAGPTARGCCYQVQQDFIMRSNDDYMQDAIIQKGDNFYFDNVTYVQKQSEQQGLNIKQWHTDYALCTICSGQFYSYRRENKIHLRNITLAALK